MAIQLEKLTYEYMQGSALSHKAVAEVDLTVEAGEFLGLIGHTGSGKSTLVQLMGGLLQPTAGRVLVEGLDMGDKKQRAQARRHVGLVFQYPEYQLFEETVARDVAYGPRNMGLGEEEIQRRVDTALGLVGLPPSNSGKIPLQPQRRRAAAGGPSRVIAMEPKYLILDEPMAGLDPQGRRDILHTIDGLREKTGCGVVMVSHSMEDVASARTGSPCCTRAGWSRRIPRARSSRRRIPCRPWAWSCLPLANWPPPCASGAWTYPIFIRRRR